MQNPDHNGIVSDLMSNAHLVALGLTERSDAFHPSALGYVIAVLAVFAMGTLAGALVGLIRGSRDDGGYGRIEPHL
jgi:hypothetical protein